MRAQWRGKRVWSAKGQKGRAWKMLVAAGPFCLRSDLDYAPLEQVLEHAASQRPQVTGPRSYSCTLFAVSRHGSPSWAEIRKEYSKKGRSVFC